MADGKRFVVECRWDYASSCYGSLTIPCTKLLKNVGRVGGRGVGRVCIPYNSTFRYTGPWHTRIAITFVRFNIFTRGFLQRFKHRLDLILSFVLSQGNFLVLSQDATFSFVTGVVGVGALARARMCCTWI